MFKKDSWTTGFLIGALLPLLGYALTILILSFWGNVDGMVYTPKPQVPGLVGIAASIVAFRYYMVSLKFDKTGRGILVTAFVLFLANFILL